MPVQGQRTLQALLLSLLLAAETAAAAPITTLVVTADGPCVCHAPMFVGIAKGIFAKHGLNIQLTIPATGFEALKQVVDGTAQVGAAAPAVIAQTMAQGARLKSIFTAFGDATGKVATDNYIAVVAGKASGIREGRVEDLSGKKVGVPRGTIAHQYLYYALVAKGLDPLNAVTIVPTPPPGLPGALQNGSVDAIVIWEPVASQALQSASGSIVVQRGGNHIQFIDLRVVSSRYLATHPGTIKRYIAAFAEAAQYVRAHPDETTDIMMQQVRGVSRETVRAAVGYLDTDVRVSKATVQTAQQGYDFAIKIGALKQAPTFEEMFDLRILRQVERERPELFRDLPPIPDAQKL